jgi:hypothetical protein
MAIGASDSNEDITDFSSGEKVVTDDAWGSDAPSNWPEEYIVPDVAAPGNGVKSSLPGGDYGTKSGTSMASPHVAGLAALMVAASGGQVTPTEIWDTLESTAWKPDSWDEGNANYVIDGKDTRYGQGIVDAPAAVELVTIDTGVQGTVESEGEPVDGATVELDGFSVQTDSTGAFEISATPGEYELSVSKTGIEEKTVTVTVEDSGSLTDLGTITVDPATELMVLDGQRDKLEGGDTVGVTLDAYNVETIQVSLTGTYEEDDAALSIDGQSAGFGEEISLDDYTGELTVSVETTAETSGSLALEHTVTGVGDQMTVSTGSSNVVKNLVRIGVIDAYDYYGGDIVQALDSQLGVMFKLSETTTTAVVDDPGAYDGVVVQRLDSGLVSEFVSTTASSDTGVVYLDQWGTEADGIPQFAGESADVTDTGDGYFDGTPYYAVESDHPILDGFSTGEDIVIHNGSDEDYSWFTVEGAFDQLASMKAGSTVAGGGLAIDEDTRTVLAATLGRSSYVSEDDFTAEANTILASAVAYAATGGSLSFAASGETGVSPGGKASLTLEGINIESATVADLWLDWTVDTVDTDGTFDSSSLSSTGTCSFDWSGTELASTSTLTLSLPDRYVGGEYVTVLTASAGEDTVETTARISVK